MKKHSIIFCCSLNLKLFTAFVLITLTLGFVHFLHSSDVLGPIHRNEFSPIHERSAKNVENWANAIHGSERNHLTSSSGWPEGTKRFSWKNPEGPEEKNWQSKLVEKSSSGKIPQWMMDQIGEDFSSFKFHSSSELDSLMNTPKAKEWLLAKIAVSGGQLFIHSPFSQQDIPSPLYAARLKSLTNSLHLLHQCCPLQDLEVIVSLHDAYPCGPQEDLSIPILCFAKNKHIHSNAILIPDFEALEDHSSLFKILVRGNKKYPWEEKKEIAFWRGSTTGALNREIVGEFSLENYCLFPRVKLTQLSIDFPQLIDAKFTQLCQGAERLPSEFKNLVGPSVSVENHLKYKYQLLIDGNSCAYSRAYWQLFSETVIFKQDSEDIQWFYRALLPNVHYIEIDRDLQTLVEKIHWAKSHDDQVHEIAKNAKIFALENLQRSDIYLYLSLVLSNCAQKL